MPVGEVMSRTTNDLAQVRLLFGFGALKGLLIATLIYLVVSLAYQVYAADAKARPEWVKQSRSYPLLDVTSRAIIGYVERRRHEQPAPAQ